MTDRDGTVRARRRQEALDSLALEQEREVALSERLDTGLRDLEAWRADEAAFAGMEPDDVETLRRIGFATKRPPGDARIRIESQIAEIEAELAESRRRQRAFQRYAEALE